MNTQLHPSLLEGTTPEGMERARKSGERWLEIVRRVKEGTATPEEQAEYDAAEKRYHELDPNVLTG